MFDRLWIWVLRGVWLSLPLTAGGLVADAVDGGGTAVRATAAVLAWVAWGVGLVAALVPHPASLTALRLLAPGAAAGALVAAVAAPSVGAMTGVGLAATGAAAVLALGAPVGERWIDSLSYGDERRLPLRPPGLLLLGPLPLSAAIPVATALAGPLLLAARHWVLGAVVTVTGGLLSIVLVRSLHALTERWLVLVPAGLVLHDHLALADPLLFRRAMIASLGPAPADTAAPDLTQQSPGLALELRLKEPTTVSRRAGRGEPERLEDLDALLFSPTRPGRVLAAAAGRRIPVS